MKKIIGFLLTAGIMASYVGGVSAAEKSDSEYNWQKIYATEFNNLKEIKKNGDNYTLGGETVADPHYNSAFGTSYRWTYQSPDGMVFFCPYTFNRFGKENNVLVGNRPNDGGKIYNSFIYIASSDNTENPGGSLLPQLNDGGRYKVTAEVAVGGADAKGYTIPVTIDGTSGISSENNFRQRWNPVHEMSKDVNISTAKSSSELQESDWQTVTWYTDSWWPTESAGAPRSIAIGIISPKGASDTNHYGNPYFNSTGDYFIALRSVMIEKGTPGVLSATECAHAKNLNSKPVESRFLFTHDSQGDYNFGNIAIMGYNQTKGYEHKVDAATTGLVLEKRIIDKEGLPIDVEENPGFLMLNMVDKGETPTYNKFTIDDYGNTVTYSFMVDTFGYLGGETPVQVSVETITAANLDAANGIFHEEIEGSANRKTYTLAGAEKYGDADIDSSYKKLINYSYEINDSTKDVIGINITFDIQGLNDETEGWPATYNDYHSLSCRIQREFSISVKGIDGVSLNPQFETMDDGYMIYVPNFNNNTNAISVFAVYDQYERLNYTILGKPNKYFNDTSYVAGTPAKCFVWRDFSNCEPLRNSTEVN